MVSQPTAATLGVGLAVVLAPFAPVAVPIAGLAILLGVGAALGLALARSDDRDILERVQGLHRVRDIVLDLIERTDGRGVWDPLGFSRTDLVNVTQSTIQSGKQRQWVVSQFPDFATSADAVAWRDRVRALNRELIIDFTLLATAVDYVDRELIRIPTGVTPQGAREDPTLVGKLATLPTFADIFQADAWFVEIQTAFNLRRITAEGMARATTHYHAELDRLKAATVSPGPGPGPGGGPAAGPTAAQIAAFKATLPTFASVAAAETFRDQARAGHEAGQLERWKLDLVEAHVDAEIARLKAAAAAGGAASSDAVVQAVKEVVAALATVQAQLASDGVTSQQQLAALGDQIAAMTALLENPPLSSTEIPAITPAIQALPGVLGGAGVGTLSGSLTQALSATAGPNAHAAQQARYSCQGSFAPALAQIAAQFLPGVLGVGGGFLGPAFAGSLTKLGIEAIFKQLETADIAAPADERTALDVAKARLNQAVLFGMQAQIISVASEAISPLKNMGFHQLGAFMADLAGFGRIAQGVMGTIEQAAMISPLRWQANRQFRPTLPDARTVELMFQKRSLTLAELRDIEERTGLPDLVIDRLPGFIFNDPRLGELVRIFQLDPPPATVAFSQDDKDIMARAGITEGPDAYLQLKLAKAGYDPTDVVALIPAIKMGLLRREQTLRYEQITRLWRDGYIAEERARAEIAAAMKPAPVVDYRMAALHLQREFAESEDIKGLVLASLRKGLITQAEASAQLSRLGFDPGRADLLMLRELVSAAPRQSTAREPEEDVLGLVGGEA